MSGRKKERLREDIRRELSSILEFESRDPVVRNAFPTVMEVRLTVDGRYAKVYVAVGGDADKADVGRALAQDRGFYRSTLAERLSLRHTPELRFVIDETVERALRLQELLSDEGAELVLDRKAQERVEGDGLAGEERDGEGRNEPGS